MTEATTTTKPLNPAGGRLTARTDRRLVPSSDSCERHVLIEIAAPTGRRDVKRAAANLGYVLDRSGSMSGWNSFPLAKQAVIEAISRQNDADGFAVVLYDHEVTVTTQATTATEANRRSAAQHLEGVEPRGNTDLAAGWLAGCEQIAGRLSVGGVNRVLLLTDGLANTGLTDPAEIARLAADLRTRGITTSTFGVGSDFNEQLLQQLADAGGGHFYFIGDVAQMRDHITSEVGEALDVTVQNAVVEVQLPEMVAAESLSPYRAERVGDRLRVHVGDLVSGQALQLVVRLQFRAEQAGAEVGAIVRVTDQDGAFDAVVPAVSPVPLSWTYAGAADVESQPRDVDVDRAVAALRVGVARQAAVALNREGRYTEAVATLAAARAAVGMVAGSDVQLREMVAALSAEAAEWAAPQPEMVRKQAFFASSTSARSRTPDGKSRQRD